MRDLYHVFEAMVRLYFLCSEKRGIGQKRHLVYLRLFKTVFWGETHCEKDPYHSLKNVVQMNTLSSRGHWNWTKGA